MPSLYKKGTKFDWVTILAYVALVAVGWIAIYTADYDEKASSILNFSYSYGRQAVWALASFGIVFMIQIVDTKFFTSLSYPIYLGALFGLVFVLLLGNEISGSSSWFKIGNSTIQPSEFAKFATCLAIAKFLSNQHELSLSYQTQFVTASLVGVPMLLTLMQGDAGTALVFSSLSLALYREGFSGVILLIAVILAALFILGLVLPYFVVMLIVAFAIITIWWIKEGIDWRETAIFALPIAYIIFSPIFLPPTFVLTTVSLMLIAFGFFMLYKGKLIYSLLTAFILCSLYLRTVDYAFKNILEPHQQNRIGIILGLITDNKGVGYNLNQSKIAIGSGGFWGKGFLNGTQNKGNFVPELNTDFIFCTIGEEFGFMGSMVLVGLFSILFFRIIMLAERQQSKYSRIYAYSVVSILFFHFAINIGMTIGLVPVIGIPLPFISYGGSSLLSFSILLGILIKLDSERYLYLT